MASPLVSRSQRLTAYPCRGPQDSVLRMRASRVPWSRSLAGVGIEVLPSCLGFDAIMRRGYLDVKVWATVGRSEVRGEAVNHRRRVTLAMRRGHARNACPLRSPTERPS